MIPVMSNLRRLAEDSGAAVVVIHHQRKGNGIKGRAGDTLRGHSCIEAALDLALLVEREEASDRVSVKSTKTRDVDVLPFSAEWTYEHKPASSELATARFFGAEPEQDDRLESIRLTISTCIKASPGVNQRKLVEAVKAKLQKEGVNKIRQQLAEMVDAGEVKTVGGKAGQKIAYWPNNDYVDF